MPAMPCTGMAPIGSSIFILSSSTTMGGAMSPAMKPMTTAAHGSTNAQPAVMPTRAAIAPLPICDTSSVRNMISAPIAAPMTPPAAARLVLTITSAKFWPTAARVDAPLKPIQPTHRMITPSMNSGIE